MQLQPGARLGPYEVIALIGAGGMGEVWVATELRLGRKVALKLLPPDLTRDPVRIQRFEQEARAASALNHPNVCTIHALGETSDGQHYIAMEYVEGATLRQRLATSRLSVREALDIAIQVTAALSVAHAAGIVHRDIKPENVMLRPDGVVKVLDFGLAKLAAVGPPGAETTQLGVNTDAGTVMGTAAYMSPEQARGQPVDARTDIWSLGVMLYEMIAGRSAFAGPSGGDVLAAILQNEPAPVSRFEPDAPAELLRILTKALRKDRSQRYQTVQDLLLDLQALREDLQSHAHLGSLPVPAVTMQPAPSGSSRTVVPRRRSPHVWLALTAAVLVVGAVLSVWARRTAQPVQMPVEATSPPVQRNLTRLTFGEGLQTDVTWSPDGTRIAYASDRSGNFDIWSQAVGGGDPVQITKSPASDSEPAWSLDGKNIAFRSERADGGIFVAPALGGPERKLSSFGVHPQWSPDGTAIMFVGAAVPNFSNVYRVSADGGEPPRELLKEFVAGGTWEWIAFHPDGRVSLLGKHGRRGFGFSTVSPEGTRVTPSSIPRELPLRVAAQGTRVRRFQWNATGDALIVEAVVNEVRNVWRVNVDPKTLAWLSAERLTTGIGADVAAAISRDGERVAFTTQQESVRLWVFPFDAVSGRVTGEGRPVSPEGADVTPSALSRDGRTVAYGLKRAGSDRTDLWLTEIESGKSELLAQNADGPCWSPDGKSLAYNLFRADSPPPGEWALAIRELRGAERVVSRWSSQERFQPHDWTGDGRAIMGTYSSPIYTGMARLELWTFSHPATLTSRRVLVKDDHARIWQGRFSPNGRWLSFVVESVEDRSHVLQLAVTPATGGVRSEWTRIAREHEWPDKPRWSPDGRTIYFVSRHNSSFFNLWGNRFDAESGEAVGEPFRVTQFDAPNRMIWPDVGSGSEIDISARHALLTMAAVTGNIWMLDHVGK